MIKGYPRVANPVVLAALVTLIVLAAVVPRWWRVSMYHRIVLSCGDAIFGTLSQVDCILLPDDLQRVATSNEAMQLPSGVDVRTRIAESITLLESDRFCVLISAAVECDELAGIGLDYKMISSELGSSFYEAAEWAEARLRRDWKSWINEIAQVRPLSTATILFLSAEDYERHVLMLRIRRTTIGSMGAILIDLDEHESLVRFASRRSQSDPFIATVDVFWTGSRTHQRILVQSDEEIVANDVAINIAFTLSKVGVVDSVNTQESIQGR